MLKLLSDKLCTHCLKPVNLVEFDCRLSTSTTMSFGLCQGCLRQALMLFDRLYVNKVYIKAPEPARAEESTDTPAEARRVCDEFLALNGLACPKYAFAEFSGPQRYGSYSPETQTVTVFTPSCVTG